MPVITRSQYKKNLIESATMVKARLEEKKREVRQRKLIIVKKLKVEKKQPETIFNGLQSNYYFRQLYAHNFRTINQMSNYFEKLRAITEAHYKICDMVPVLSITSFVKRRLRVLRTRANNLLKMINVTPATETEELILNAFICQMEETCVLFDTYLKDEDEAEAIDKQEEKETMYIAIDNKNRNHKRFIYINENEL